MSCHADRRPPAKFHLVQRSGERGSTLQLACAPSKELRPICAVDLKRRRLTQENRHLPLQPCLLQQGWTPHKEHYDQRDDGQRENPRSPGCPAARFVRALMVQPRKNPACKEGA